MEFIEQAQKNKEMPEDLHKLSHVGDPIHIWKSLKCSISNWYLEIEDQYCNLSIIRNLREDKDIGKVIRKHVSLDTVRNKDRMSDVGPRELAKPEVIDTLQSIEWVGHPLYPEKWRLPADNKVGMIKQPVSVCVGNMHSLYIIDGHTGNLFSARLHYPLQIKQIYQLTISATDVCYSEGIIFLSAKVGLYYIDHTKVLAISPNTMTSITANKFCIKNHILTKNDAKHASLNEMRKKSLGKTQTPSGPVRKMQCNVAFSLLTAVTAVSKDVLYIADLKDQMVYEVFAETHQTCHFVEPQ